MMMTRDSMIIFGVVGALFSCAAALQLSHSLLGAAAFQQTTYSSTRPYFTHHTQAVKRLDTSGYRMFV